MATAYESYEVIAPYGAGRLGIYDTYSEAHGAAQADADTDAAWDRSYEIRGYDGRVWHHVDDYVPVRR